MGKRDEQKKTGLVVSPSPLLEGPEGQLSLMPDIPDTVQKGRGAVFDSLMMQTLEEQGPLLLDDVSETTGKPLPVQTKIMLSYEGIDFDIKGRIELTPFDREVLDAVATLYQNNKYMTSAHIYRVMMGKKEYQYVTPNQQKQVRESMTKCGFSKLDIVLEDINEKGSRIGKELKAYGIKATYSGPLLAFELVTVSRGEKTIDCFKILAEPAIIKYATAMGKISEYPIELLDTSVNKTPKNIVLQAFLLRNIDEMYRDRSLRRLIDIDHLYKIIGAADATPQHKARYRATACKILDDWVKMGYIEGYEIRKAGPYIKGFKIMLKESSSPKLRII